MGAGVVPAHAVEVQSVVLLEVGAQLLGVPQESER